MDLRALLPLVASALSPEGQEGPSSALGVSEGAGAALVAALAGQAGQRPLLVVTASPARAQALAQEVEPWLSPEATRPGEGGERSPLVFPPRDLAPYSRLSPTAAAVGARLRVLRALRAPTAVGALVVASVQALAQGTLSPRELAGSLLRLAPGSPLMPNPPGPAALPMSLEALLRELARWGYSPGPLVEEPGAMARRGGILDLWPPGQELPLRIELWGDRVESLRLFDPQSQRSQGRLGDQGAVPEAIIGPAREMIPSEKAVRRLAAALDLSSCSAEAQERYRHELALLGQGLGFEGDAFYTPLLARSALLEHLPLRHGESPTRQGGSPTGSLLVLEEPEEIEAALAELEKEAVAARRGLAAQGALPRKGPRGLPSPFLGRRSLLRALRGYPRALGLSRWAPGPFSAPPAYGGRLPALAADVAAWRREGRRVVLVSQQAERLAEALAAEGAPPGIASRLGYPTKSGISWGPRLAEAPPPGGLALLDAQPTRASGPSLAGSLGRGFLLGRELALLTDAEIFGLQKERLLPRKDRRPPALLDLSRLKAGDYVVHVEHGIARFAGLATKTIDGHTREYLELGYAEGDRLFVPVEQLDRVSPYVGPSDRSPTLTRLGSGDWARTRERVSRAVLELARELLALYASREVLEGHPFGLDTPWQREMELSFPYEETPDQQRAIAEVKADMEALRPMDRLVCGDVGYGKTEVAARAAFKAVMDGKQVAVLVPTTVLAQQHFQTFRERLAPFPVRVEALSRLRPPKEQRQVVKEVARGAVDIVIGTHRLLQRDVRFKELGLVVIDEEHRFGVAHKERLKQMRRQVDVLTLSATPIPRTLYMALSGIRDTSTMETPPEERLPITTFVQPYGPGLVREAILQELGRGGQVYFVHNRVQTIGRVARQVAELAPEARIAVAHGRMAEERLARVMEEFAQGEIDVLVCTTIIEAGLDMPNVNTIIIDQAHKLGLAQLYQLRGRVGRRGIRAYAYLLHDKRARLTDAARRRLQAVFEASELGAGMQIALRDLEIRGAGNLLGAEQSGQLGAVGLDLYCRLLAEAVAELKARQQHPTSFRGRTWGPRQQGEEPLRPPPSAEVSIDLPLSAHLPQDYVPDPGHRLALYRRLAAAATLGDVAELAEELRDRFGALPPPAQALLYALRLRALARRAHVRSITTEEGEIVLRLAPGRRVDAVGARHAVPLLPPTVHVGTTQVRLALGRGWQESLLAVLEALAGPAAEPELPRVGSG